MDTGGNDFVITLMIISPLIGVNRHYHTGAVTPAIFLYNGII